MKGMSDLKTPVKDGKKSGFWNEFKNKIDVTSVSLPQFPKNVKIEDRTKWMEDYDKIHNELLQHHIGLSSEQVEQLKTHHHSDIQPHMTDIISLRQLPGDWEKRQNEEELKRLEKLNVRQKKVSGENNMKTLRNLNITQSRFVNSLENKDGSSPLQKVNCRDSPHAKEGCVAGKPDSTDVCQSRNITSQRQTSSREGFWGSLSTTKVPTVSPVISPFPFSKTYSIDECAGVISNLLSPPPRYLPQVRRIKMDNINLSWILHYRGDDFPSVNLSLDTIRDDLLTSPSGSAVTAINSPRSVIVMLRNGVSVKHLQIVPMEKIKPGENKFGPNLNNAVEKDNYVTKKTNDESQYKQKGVFSDNNSNANKNIKSISGKVSEQGASENVLEELRIQAYRHIEDRRRNLLSMLREEYHTLCKHVPLHDLVSRILYFINTSDEKETFSIMGVKGKSNSVKKTKHFADGEQNDMRVLLSDNSKRLEKRKNKLERLLHISLDQIIKQEGKTIEIIKEEMESEEKRLRTKIMHEELASHAQIEILRKRQETLIKQKHFRNETEQAQDEYNNTLLERYRELEAKENIKRERRAQHIDKIREEGKVKSLKRKERAEKQKELIVEMTQLRQTELKEKEFKCQERIQQKRAQAAEQRALSLKRAHMKREEARKAAELEEEKIIENAQAKFKAVERRLDEFHSIQEEKLHNQHIKDLEKKSHHQKIRDNAKLQLEERNISLIYKQLSHEEQIRKNNAVKLEKKQLNAQQEQLCHDDKHMFLERKAQAMNFNMLLAMNSIDEKKRRAKSIEEQKKNMLEVVMAERDQLNDQWRKNVDILNQRSMSNTFDRYR